MSEYDISGIPEEVGRLEEIEAKRTSIQQIIESGQAVDETVRSAYEIAIDRLGETALELASTPEVMGHYTQEAIHATAALAQLEPLEGVLPEEQLAGMRQDYETRKERAEAFIETYGSGLPVDEHVTAGRVAAGGEAVRRTTTTALVAETLQTSNERSPQKEISIRVGLNFVRISKHGQAVPYSNMNRRRPEYRDYTEPRRNALIALLSLDEDTTISARDLHSAAFGDEEFHSNNLLMIRSWFEKLTYNNRPILSHTSRGDYFISPAFRTVMTYGDKYQAHLAAQEAGEASQPTNNIESPKEESKFDRGDLWITANQLRPFNFVLLARGIKEVSDEMWEGLSDYKPDLSVHKDRRNDIHEYRLKAIQRLEDLMCDGDAFFEYTDSLDEESGEYLFVEFLSGLNEQQMKLVRSLLTARLVTAGVTGRLQVFGSTEKQVYDKDDVLLYPLMEDVHHEQAATNGHVLADTEELLEEELLPEPTAAVDEKVEPLARPGAEVEIAADEDTAVLRVAEATPRRGTWSEREQNLFDEAKAFVKQNVETFISSLDPKCEYGLPRIMSVIPRVNANAVANAKDARLLRRVKRGVSDKTYSIEDVMKVLLNANGNLHGLLKTRKYRKHTEELIRRTIEHTIEESRRRELAKV